MPNIFSALLPDTDEKIVWKEIDMQELFLQHPELNMKSIDDQNKLIHQDNSVRTYGDFGKDRTKLWDGFETHGKKMIHLGVDFNNLTVGERVTSLTKGTVVHIWKDETKMNGWGGRVVIKTGQIYLLYGHLHPDSLPQLDQKVEVGNVIGRIGSEDLNGGWFPHLHLQIMTEKFVQERNNDWLTIDGYEEALPDSVLDPVKFILQSRPALIYNLVHDEEQIKKFAELIQVDMNAHVVHVNCRPKYNPDFKQERLSTFPCVDLTTEEFVDLIRRCEIEIGSYRQNDKPIPANALVIYCTTNPRDAFKAGRKMLKLLVEAGLDKNMHTFNNLQSKATSTLMSSKGKTKLITIDIDDKKDYDEVKNFFQHENIPMEAVVETRGGYHVLFRPFEQSKKVFDAFKSKHTIGDVNCPIPGTYQGGFPVRFLEQLPS